MAAKPQFKANQLAKDLELKSKDIVDIMSEKGIEIKSQKTLEPREFDILFDAITSRHQIEGIDDYIDGVTYVPSKLIEKPKAEVVAEEPKKVEEKSSESKATSSQKAEKTTEAKAPAAKTEKSNQTKEETLEEKPAAKKPAEQKPVEEKPVAEKPVAEKSVEEKPVAEAVAPAKAEQAKPEQAKPVLNRPQPVDRAAENPRIMIKTTDLQDLSPTDPRLTDLKDLSLTSLRATDLRVAHRIDLQDLRAVLRVVHRTDLQDLKAVLRIDLQRLPISRRRVPKRSVTTASLSRDLAADPVWIRTITFLQLPRRSSNLS